MAHFQGFSVVTAQSFVVLSAFLAMCVVGEVLGFRHRTKCSINLGEYLGVGAHVRPNLAHKPRERSAAK